MKLSFFIRFTGLLLLTVTSYFVIRCSTPSCTSSDCYAWQTTSPYGGSYLTHKNGKAMNLTSNPSMAKHSVFLTSDQGEGYQAELKAGATAFSSLGEKTSSSIACQQPFGYPISCTSGCDFNVLENILFTPCTGPVVNAMTFSPSASMSHSSTLTDFLNENGTQPTSGTAGVFLSSIVNNSNSAFEFATTTAPLYGTIFNSTTGTYSVDPNTIAGAIAAGTLNIYSNIYAQKPSGMIKLGGNQYPFNFIAEAPTVPDNRYLLAGANQHNPGADALALKINMADPQLSLDVSPTGPGNQTIMLFPSRMQTTCQPVIFIGRDKDNVFYAISYLGAYTSTTGQECCVSSTGGLCPTDMIYPNPDTMNLAAATMTNTNEGDPNFIRVGSPGRLAVNIQCIAKTGGYGYAASIASQNSLWYPGQPGFSNIPTAPTACSS